MMSTSNQFSQKKNVTHMRYIATLLLLILPQLLLAGISGKISGKITDSVNGEPLIGVNVFIPGTQSGAATDAEGEYYILNVRPGTYTVTASMVGYQLVTSNDVSVITDHTVTLNFVLPSTVIAGEELIVTAEREVIIMDRSASEINITADELASVPAVRDISDFLNVESGIEDDLIRGGSLDQTALMVDGLSVVDNRSNEPVMMLNMSSVDQVNIIKGGFNAEYGNIRSGLINVITKDGSTSGYSGSIDIQMDPAQQKHGGYSLFDPMNYYIRPFLEPGVMWSGTREGLWTEEEQNSYPEFVGWNEVSANTLSDNDPSNDMSPQQARDLFLYYHRLEGSSEFGQEEGAYANKPDCNIDAGVGGPVPLIGQHLGDMTFYITHRSKLEMFALPTAENFYREANTHLKLTIRPTDMMKVKFDALYGEVHTLSGSPEGSGNNFYLTSGKDILWSYLATSDAYAEGGGSALFWPQALNPFKVYRSMVGASLDHVLSPSTFYNLRISNTRVKNACYGPEFIRDTTAVGYFGNQSVDEAPFGFWVSGDYTPSGDGMIFASLGGVTRDQSEVNTLNFKFDMTSQVNKRHEAKVGFEFNYDDLYTNYQSQFDYAPKNNYVNQYRAFPMRMGAYVQDKIEIKGLVANVGLRMDYNDPNQDWYSVDRYSKYLSPTFKDQFTSQAPTEKAKGHVKISPRLGVSHPISADAKLYFNYGHFYSMPSSIDMYQIGYGTAYQGIDYLGNPSADIPKSVAYELGMEYSVNDQYLLHASGYYKDVSNQIGYVGYTNIDGSVSYSTTENNNYEDIRGFELKLHKRYGKWLTGWLNYNYMVRTWGYFGKDHYYEDPRDQMRYGFQNPKQEKPLARPFARANVIFKTPVGWGPKLLGSSFFDQIQINFLFGWKAGDYVTWDPLETHVLVDNLQWRNQFSADMRIGKNIEARGLEVMYFLDMKNVFNLEYISMQGFADGDDWRSYLNSLHLPLYEGEAYTAAGFTGGDDRVGDVANDDKSYINMPNRGFLTYLNPRSLSLGLRINF